VPPFMRKGLRRGRKKRNILYTHEKKGKKRPLGGKAKKKKGSVFRVPGKKKGVRLSPTARRRREKKKKKPASSEKKRTAVP